MYIREIILDGFKSYATQTRIGPFDPSFTAITGLNGAGKSNILDSICFVLGISSLSKIRVASLTELIYKQGQAGVTRASVTLVFDNGNTSESPPGYEAYPTLEVTRQICKNGTTKYLINGTVAKLKTVKHLFRSTGLNVDNPTFLVMQGRITTILSMKPVELLSLIEECAGTTVYEHNRNDAVKLFAAKETKLQEVSNTLDLEIMPRLQKLDAERQAAIELAHLERAMKSLELVAQGRKMYTMTASLVELCTSMQARQARIEQAIRDGRQLEEQSRQIVEAIQTLDTELQSIQISTALERLTADYNNARSSADVIQERITMARNQEESVCKQLNDKEQARKIANNAISTLRQRIGKIDADPEINTLIEQKSHIESEKKLVEARLMLLTNGSLLKATVKDNFAKISIPLSIAEALASRDQALDSFKESILMAIATGFQRGDSDKICRVVWESITVALQSKVEPLLANFTSDVTDKLFMLRGVDALTPAELLSTLPIVFSEVSAEVEPSVLALVSAYQSMEYANTDRFRIAAGTDDANAGTLLQSISDSVGQYSKLLDEVSKLCAVFSQLKGSEGSAGSSNDNVNARSDSSNLRDLVFSTTNGFISQRQYDELHSIITDINCFINSNHPALLSEASGAASTLLTELRRSFESGEEFDATVLDVKALSYINSLECSATTLQRRANKLITALSQRFATFSRHLNSIFVDTNPDKYLSNLLRMCPSGPSFSGVAYMIRALRPEVRSNYELLGPTIGFYTINTDAVRRYCSRAGVAMAERRYIQVVRVLEMIAMPKLFHVVFLSSDKVIRFLGDASLCTQRITAVPLDKVKRSEVSNYNRVREALEREGACFLTDFIDCINQTVANYVFGLTVLCENTEVATKIAYSPSFGFKCLTLEGDVVSPSGNVSGGSRNFDFSTSTSIFTAADEYRENGGSQMLLTPLRSAGAEVIDRGAEKLYQKLACSETSASGGVYEFQVAVTTILEAAKIALHSLQRQQNDLLSLIEGYPAESIKSGLPLALTNVLVEKNITHLLHFSQLNVMIDYMKSSREYNDATVQVAKAVGKIILLNRFVAEMKVLASDSSEAGDPTQLREAIKDYAAMFRQVEDRLAYLTRKYNKEQLEIDLAAAEEDEKLLQQEMKGMQTNLRAMATSIAELGRELEQQNLQVETLNAQLREQNNTIERVTVTKTAKEAEYKKLQARMQEGDTLISVETTNLTELREKAFATSQEHEALVDTFGGMLSTICAMLLRVTNYALLVDKLQELGVISTPSKRLNSGPEKSRRSTGKAGKTQLNKDRESDEMVVFLPQRLLQLLDVIRQGNSTEEQIDYNALITQVTQCATVAEFISGYAKDQNLDVAALIKLLMETSMNFLEKLQEHLASSHTKLTLAAGVSTGSQGTYEELRTNAIELQRMRDRIDKDKERILGLISTIDDKKMVALQASYERINSDLDKIFATLLPSSRASLRLVDESDLSKGVLFDVTLGETRTTVSCLSGGQRSLLALSLILALLLHKPCPLYILDEIDAALDLNHTYNIGALIRNSFPGSQFIIISLKDGLFSNANVLFQVKLSGGSSAVERYARSDSKDGKH